jgi:hypothetical protein
VIEEVIRTLDVDDAYFWATHNGAEIDLIFRMYGKTYGVECKRADAPHLTPSMRIALKELNLTRLTVIYPGTVRYQLAPHIFAVPAIAIPEGFKGLFGSA